jgi:Tfp pilus assembly protein PilO
MKASLSTTRMAAFASVAAVLALAIILGLMFLLPVPTAADARTQGRLEEREVIEATLKTRQEADRLETEIAGWVWTISPAEIEPAALARATSLAAARNIRLSAFRPQRPQEAGGLVMLPFTMAVEGAYPNVHSFVQDLDAPDTRLAVTLVQLSAVDGITDTVTATIGVAAFVRTAEVTR